MSDQLPNGGKHTEVGLALHVYLMIADGCALDKLGLWVGVVNRSSLGILWAFSIVKYSEPIYCLSHMGNKWG